MRIAILSGKGGTGKTTVSNNMAAVIPGAALVDCDVEEPNSHLIMRPVISSSREVSVGYPLIDQDRCTHCRACANFCRFNAILANDKVTVPIKELCHDCGGCRMVCRPGAISYDRRSIGTVFSGTAVGDTPFYYGLMNVGENSGVKIIRETKKDASRESLLLIDSPPGTSCSTVAALEGVDYAVIVTEPTPFGVSDMKMVVEMLREMATRFSVIINKAGIGDDEVYRYCQGEGIEISGEIPYDRTMAESYSRGNLVSLEDEKYARIFKDLFAAVMERAGELK